MLGIPLGTLKGKLGGSLPIRDLVLLRLDEIDMMRARGVPPQRWPSRLRHRILPRRKRGNHRRLEP